MARTDDPEASAAQLMLDRASAREQVEDEHDDGEDEEEMNPAAEGVAADDAKQPQYEQNDGDRPKHFFPPEICPAISAGLVNKQLRAVHVVSCVVLE